jgi:hypothetical protein
VGRPGTELGEVRIADRVSFPVGEADLEQTLLRRVGLRVEALHVCDRDPQRLVFREADEAQRRGLVVDDDRGAGRGASERECGGGEAGRESERPDAAGESLGLHGASPLSEQLGKRPDRRYDSAVTRSSGPALDFDARCPGSALIEARRAP